MHLALVNLHIISVHVHVRAKHKNKQTTSATCDAVSFKPEEIKFTVTVFEQYDCYRLNNVLYNECNETTCLDNIFLELCGNEFYIFKHMILAN